MLGAPERDAMRRRRLLGPAVAIWSERSVITRSHPNKQAKPMTEFALANDRPAQHARTRLLAKEDDALEKKIRCPMRAKLVAF